MHLIASVSKTVLVLFPFTEIDSVNILAPVVREIGGITWHKGGFNMGITKYKVDGNKKVKLKFSC